MTSGPSWRFQRVGVSLFLPTLVLGTVLAQSSVTPTTQDTQNWQALSSKGAWVDLLAAVGNAAPGADALYYKGLALAGLGRYEEAEAAFVQGLAVTSDRGPLLVELAGVHFKQKRFHEASDELREAVSRGQTDAYVMDLLGTVYFLQGNLEAALKYWNQAGKPEIVEVHVAPPDVLDPVLLDHLMALRPASRLDLRDLELTRARLDNLGVFARQSYRLVPRPDTRFDLNIQTLPAAGLIRGSNLQNLVLILRDLPFETLHADLTNLQTRGRNWFSLLRWQSENQRFSSEFNAPLAKSPGTQYAILLEARNEEWNDARSERPGVLTDIKRLGVAGELRSVATERFTWLTGASLDAYGAPAGVASSPWLLKSIWEARYRLLNSPEDALDSHIRARAEIGRAWDIASHAISRVEVGVTSSWAPAGPWSARFSLSAGQTHGALPLDQLFRLGMDRDNYLLLRGHSGTIRSRKGFGPIGEGYLLANLELSRQVYSNGILVVSAGPFLDVGRLHRPLTNSPTGWLCDPGIEARFRVLQAFTLALSWGFSLDSHRGLLYARSVER